ncbi:hypothetical protein [Altibacter lentus]|uniref:hypothetical protein n=1 Tax=Altibacter lentus TaxID=1223410 RepID=UPI00054D5DD6|nr:hypothetical protein [Altibacter lentus]
MKNKRFIIIIATVVFLLFLPFVAMQFTTQVRWTLFDFVIMGVLLLGTGLLCEWILRKVNKTPQRILLCVTVIAVFLLIWAELAVGVFGTYFAGQ